MFTNRNISMCKHVTNESGFGCDLFSIVGRWRKVDNNCRDLRRQGRILHAEPAAKGNFQVEKSFTSKLFESVMGRCARPDQRPKLAMGIRAVGVRKPFPERITDVVSISIIAAGAAIL